MEKRDCFFKNCQSERDILMATINKAELIKEVAESTDLNKTQSDQAIDAVFSAIQNALAKDEKVQLIGFGSFEVRNRAARKGP